MFLKLVLSAIIAVMAFPLSLRADEAYTTKLGDKQITSVSRTITMGGGLSREELTRAARESVPIKIAPINLAGEDKAQ
jgi:hypothetical protein